MKCNNFTITQTVESTRALSAIPMPAWNPTNLAKLKKMDLRALVNRVSVERRPATYAKVGFIVSFLLDELWNM